MHSTHASGGDPRDLITEQVFSVAPELLGIPLARPTRRAWGILIDLFLISILSKATGVLLAGSAAWVLFRAVSKRWGATRRVWVRAALGGGAALIGFALLLSAWSSASGLVARVVRGGGGEDAAVGVLNGVEMSAAALRLRGASTPDEARERGRDVVEQLPAQEWDEEEVRELVEDLLPDSAWAPEVARAVAGAVERDAAAAGTEAPASASTDSLAAAYAAARARGDSVPQLRERLGEVFAADELNSQNRQIERLQARNDRLKGELDDARGTRGVIAWLRAAADDLGLGFGWSALYFTAFLVLGKGRTPGKRIAGTRVVRLDGRPITWWVAFERFGGYVAGVFTGLLDYFLLVRDPNRQALHDKIVNTVVIRV